MPEPAKPPGKKGEIMGLPPWAAVLALGVGVLLVFFVLRSKSQQQATTASGGDTSTITPDYLTALSGGLTQIGQTGSDLAGFEAQFAADLQGLEAVINSAQGQHTTGGGTAGSPAAGGAPCIQIVGGPDCEPGFRCLNGTCQATGGQGQPGGCVKDKDCGAGMACHSHQCVPKH